MLFTDAERERKLLAKRLPGGRSLALPGGGSLAGWDGGFHRLYAPDGAVRAVDVPAEGAWYAVEAQPFRLRYGFGRLGAFRVKRYPKRNFELGIFGEMTLRIVHVCRLRGILEQGGGWKETLTAPEWFEMLRGPLAGDAVRAVSGLCGPPPWPYERLEDERQALEERLYALWFRTLYESGLLIPHRSFSLLGLTRPMIETGGKDR